MALPTRDEMLRNTLGELDRAYRALGDAADWMRSDFRPVGAALTDSQVAARTATYEQVDAAKAAINRAKDAIWSALDDAHAVAAGEDADGP